MQSITFHTMSLQVVESTDHVFLLSSKDVANGYEISESVLRSHKNNQSDELIEGTHFIMTRTANNAAKTMWTKLGVITLGLFVKSERAKEFRKWAASYVLNGHEADNHLKEIILLQNEQMVQMSKEINRLKGVLIRNHDEYHKILTTCSPIQMIDELRKMTNIFQLIGNTKSDGKNLNTETVSGHKYWNVAQQNK